MPTEIFLLLLLAGAVLLGIAAALALAVVAVRRTTALAGRLDALERQSARLAGEPAVPTPALPETADAPVAPEPSTEPPPRPAIDWEQLVGGKGLGWTAVALLVLATAFFIRHAFAHRWIDPLGRVAFSCGVGLLALWGGRLRDRAGLPVLARMLSAAGVVILYLATWAAFGYYDLLPREAASAYLLAVVVGSMALALAYDAWPLALAAVVGGLATPVMLASDSDSYPALFSYLAALDLGVVLILWRRRWPALGTIALLGSQLLFWSWHEARYHPVKLDWALGFQLTLFALFLVPTIGPALRGRRTSAEGLALLVLDAGFAFGGLYALLAPDLGPWMATMALALAATYLALARATLRGQPVDGRLTLVLVALTAAHVAIALPLHRDTAWVGVGWAALAGGLWFAGLRIAARPLRVLAAALGGLAAVRMLGDLPFRRAPFVPLFNEATLPALAVCGVLLLALAWTRRFPDVPGRVERWLVGAATLGALGLLLLVLSIEASEFCLSHARAEGSQAWRWMAGMSVSILWAGFAGALLSVGMRARDASLRWAAIALFAVTAGKVVLVDMATLAEIYRVGACFAVAVLLGVGARAYARPGHVAPDSAPAPEGSR